MDYQKKLQQYRERIKNGAPFVDFLETLFEWVENLYTAKRIRKEQEILSYYPHEIFTELDTASAEISAENYEKLKSILLRETSELINFIISVGNLKRTDFDVLQFKLSQIFGKEEITTMLEWARLHLVQVVKEREKEKSKTEEEERIAEEEYLVKIRALPQSELNKLVVSQMFDFSPRARTPLERQEAIQKNKHRVVQQKEKFRRFEEKLLDATIEARAEAQSKVYQQIGVVKREMDTVVGEFQQKAKDFASEEGPKKEIGKAQERIAYHTEIFSRGIEGFRQKMVGKGAGWKEMFREETKQARARVLKGAGRLKREITVKGEDWEKEFGTKIETTRRVMLEKKKIFGTEQQQAKEGIGKKGKEELQEAGQRVGKGAAHFAEEVQLARTEIQEKGQQEINQARNMMLKEKAEFETEVEQAQGKFSEKAEEIDYAKKDFIRERDTAREKFIRRGQEIEMGMYGNIYEGKKKFNREREEARERFMSRAEEIQGRAAGHITEKRDKFLAGKEEGRRKFQSKAEEIKGRGKSWEASKLKRPEFKGFQGREKLAVGSEQLVAGARASKSRMAQERQKMMLQAEKGRTKMQEELQKRKDLFLYDVKFAQHNMEGRALQFGEKIAAKQEEFKARGKQLTARHRAHQKAHLIQNLLRVIRGMQ